MTPEPKAIVERLENLEKENRRLKRAGLGVLLAVSGLLVMGQARPGHKLVEAQELLLRDATGRKRAILSVSPDPHLTLYDTKGQPQADLSAMAKGGFLTLLDDSGNHSVGLGAVEDTVGLAIADKGQEIQAGIVVTRNGPTMTLSHGRAKMNVETLAERAVINLFDRDGRMTIVHPAGVILSDRNQKARLTLSSDIEEGPTVRLFDSQQNPRVELQAGKEGSSLGLRDSDGFEAFIGTVASQVHKTGEKRIRSAASLLLVDKDGKVLWSAP